MTRLAIARKKFWRTVLGVIAVLGVLVVWTIARSL
jgi:hypothetical protein